MYLGEKQQGDLLSLQVYTTSSGVGVLPDEPPRAVVIGESGQVESHLLPIDDERNVTGRFLHLVPLDAKYSEGRYWIQYYFQTSGTTVSEIHSFVIVPGGDPKGTGIAMEHFRRPPNDFILLQTDGGFLLRKKNPEVHV